MCLIFAATNWWRSRRFRRFLRHTICYWSHRWQCPYALSNVLHCGPWWGQNSQLGCLQSTDDFQSTSSLQRFRSLHRRPTLTPCPASLPWVNWLTIFSNNNSKPHNVCVFVIYFISFVVCLTFRFVASFVESTSTSIEWPIVQRIPLTPSASDQNNTSQNPNCSRATPSVAAHTSGGGLKSNQASCTYSYYAVLGYTTTGQLLPCHFGGADNTQFQRWRKWWWSQWRRQYLLLCRSL